MRVIAKKDERTGNLTDGIVAHVITHSKVASEGIKVELEDGTIGRVQEIRPNITIELTNSEALILDQFVSRLNIMLKDSSESDQLRTLLFDDQAEEFVLWNLEATLEKSLTHLLANPNYDELLKQSWQQMHRRRE